MLDCSLISKYKTTARSRLVILFFFFTSDQNDRIDHFRINVKKVIVIYAEKEYWSRLIKKKLNTKIVYRYGEEMSRASITDARSDRSPFYCCIPSRVKEMKIDAVNR